MLPVANKMKIFIVPASLLIISFVLEFAIALPIAKITLKVIDEQQKPVTGAQVHIKFAKKIIVSGMTDGNGLFTAEGECESYLFYSAKKEGYYDSYTKESMDFLDIQKVHKGIFLREEYLPWNPIQEVVLKKIEHPVSMRVKIVGEKMPVIGKPVGFDLLIGDWVKPYGKGEISDLTLTYKGGIIDSRNEKNQLTLQFKNANDGIIEMVFDERKEPSHYVFPIKAAPESGYRNLWVFKSDLVNGERQEEGLKKNQHFVLRVRTGEKDGPLYGKISREIRFGHETAKKVTIYFKYYINEKAGERSLEYDSKYLQDFAP